VNRFLLGKSGKNTLVTIGVNPSTANNEWADPTIRSFVIPISRHNDYDGWLMINPCPIICTKPYRLPDTFDPELQRTNIRHIAEAVNSLDGFDIWCAWGGSITLRPYLKGALDEVISTLKVKGGSWKRIAELNRDNTPKHPAFHNSQTELIDYMPQP
jgi:hypothetical protein